MNNAVKLKTSRITKNVRNAGCAWCDAIVWCT